MRLLGLHWYVGRHDPYEGGRTVQRKLDAIEIERAFTLGVSIGKGAAADRAHASRSTARLTLLPGGADDPGDAA